MNTATIIFCSILTVVCLALVFAVFLGKPSKDEPLNNDTVIWRKLDDHEKKIAE